MYAGLLAEADGEVFEIQIVVRARAACLTGGMFNRDRSA
jgi:hypothetical protein